jgi:tetratricopeptide (TPR) repeat protein
MRTLARITAITLIALSIVALTQAISNTYYIEGTNILEGWAMAEKLKAPPDWSWEQAHRFLWLANRLNPLDPDVLNDLGRLHELKVTEEIAHEPDSVMHLNRAAEYYRRSLERRPAFPYIWINLALLKIKQEQLDQEFALALKRAEALGPWEWNVQVGIAGGGMAVFDQLPAELQSLVKTTIDRGLQSETRAIIAIAETYGLIAPSPPDEEPPLPSK